MAKSRTLDRRRQSIRGIRKITRTMELISTARFRRAMDRAVAARAYTEQLSRLVGALARAGLETRHPLLEPRPEPRRAVLLVLSANRGLCGGYNAGVLRLAYARLRELRAAVPEVGLEVSGKRGISSFRFRRIVMDATFTQFEDRPSGDEVDALATRYLDDYATGRMDRLDVVYTKFESISHQWPVAETMLPLESPDAGAADKQTDEPVEYEFLPSAEEILDEIVPTSFKARVMKCFLDAGVSEQTARMIAMKAATENADTMISHLSMAYNRARQNQITSELLEIISGAEALNH